MVSILFWPKGDPGGNRGRLHRPGEIFDLNINSTADRAQNPEGFPVLENFLRLYRVKSLTSIRQIAIIGVLVNIF